MSQQAFEAEFIRSSGWICSGKQHEDINNEVIKIEGITYKSYVIILNAYLTRILRFLMGIHFDSG